MSNGNPTRDVERFAAFCVGQEGGNPAGVVIGESLPAETEMQAIAAAVGYSETAFAAPVDDAWRVRYFAPEIEIPFCGHASIALGAALAAREGDGLFRLRLNDATIVVEGRGDAGGMGAALVSPPTHSEPASQELVDRALGLFSYGREALDRHLPPAVIDAGARHLLLAVRSRALLAGMRYDIKEGRALMLANDFATISLVHAETATRFHARNAFAAGGVYEDPATGAAAAALAGYLRDLGWPHGGAIEIIQGEDMGIPSLLRAEVTPERAAGIRVSGLVRRIAMEG